MYKGSDPLGCIRILGDEIIKIIVTGEAKFIDQYPIHSEHFAFFVVDDGGVYDGCICMSCDQWQDDEPSHVASMAKGYLELINGILLAFLGSDLYFSHEKFTLSKIISDDGQLLISYEEAKTLPSTHPLPSSIEPLINLRDKRSFIFSKSLSNEELNATYRILGAGNFDWRDIYAVLETITAAVGGGRDKAISALGLNKDEYNLVSAHCNSFAALGPQSRHGKNGMRGITTSSISLDKARSLLINLVTSYQEWCTCYSCAKLQSSEPQVLKSSMGGFYVAWPRVLKCIKHL